MRHPHHDDTVETARRLGVEVVEDRAVAFVGRDRVLAGLALASGQVVTCQQAFFSIGHRNRDELAEQLGCHLTDEGCVAVDDDRQTSVPGVYAAGDLVPGVQLVQMAAADGARAGIAAAESLRTDIKVRSTER